MSTDELLGRKGRQTHFWSYITVWENEDFWLADMGVFKLKKEGNISTI